MKQFTILFASLMISAHALQAQGPIIFQPGPGANNGTDNGSLNGGKDAWVYEGTSTTNYGDYPAIEALPISNCNNTHCVAYIQFDVTTLPAAVDSVFVVFKHQSHTNYCYSGCNADFYFARNTQQWDEMTIDYTTMPSHDTAFYGPINISFPNAFGVREYNITSTYSLWKAGTVPNYGMTIYSTTVDCNNAAVYFAVSSSDDTSATSRPYLKIYANNTGISTIQNPGLKCKTYPNPSTDVANVEFTLAGTGNVKFQLVDFTGRTVYTKESLMHSGINKISVPLSNLEDGMYFYTLTTKEGNASGKLLKK